MKKYWSMKAKANQEAEIDLYGEIGEGMFSDGIGAKQFSDDLKALGDVKHITCHVNSPGGSVFEGVAIYNQLKMHAAKVTCVVDGLAASIASVICMAGDTIIMPENAMMMIHDPWSMVVGNADELRKTADVMDKIKESLVMAYMGKCNLPEDKVRQMMTDETWMNGNDALENGFCDECTKPMKMAAAINSFDLSKFKKSPEFTAMAPEASNPIKEIKAMKCKKHPGTDMVVDSCPVCDHEASVQNAATQTKKNIVETAKALRSIGKEYKAVDLAEYAIENDWTEDQLRGEILNRVKKASAGNGPLNISVSPAHEGKPFRNFGEQLMAVKAAAQGDAHARQRLTEVYNAPSGASEAVPSDGGFLVQSDFTTALLNRSRETQIIAPRCQHINVSGNGLNAPLIDETTRATGSRWGGVQIYRANEAGTATAKKPKIWNMEMKLEKIIGLFYATDELMADASALESIAGQAFAEEFGFKVDDEIINGTGAGQMMGILNAPCLVSQTKETGQLAATIDAQNIMKMYARMPARSKPNAVWCINSEIMPQLMNMNMTLGTAGVPLYMPAGGLSGSPFATIFGRPVIEIEQAAALGTVGDIIFADFSQYAIIEKGGINATQSIHLQFLTDETTFRWTVRNNGQPIWRSALTPYKGSATLSPFVALATRS